MTRVFIMSTLLDLLPSKCRGRQLTPTPVSSSPELKRAAANAGEMLSPGIWLWSLGGLHVSSALTPPFFAFQAGEDLGFIPFHLDADCTFVVVVVVVVVVVTVTM